MGSSEFREALLKENVRDFDEEDCPGCKIEKLKQSNHGVPYKHLLYVFVIALAAGLPISSLFPFLYFMIRDFHISEREEDIGYYAGFVGSAFMFGRFSTSVIWGIIADRYGRKPVIMFGMVTMVILNTIFGLSTNFWMAVGTRFLLGSLCGILGPLRAYASEICRREYQALALSVMSTSWGLGLVIGPAIGGFLAQPAEKFPELISQESFLGRFPYFLPCLLISAFTLGVTLFCIWLPETIHFHPKMKEHGEEVSNSIESANNGSDQKELQESGNKTVAFQQSLFKNWPLMSAIAVYCVFQLHEMAYAEIFPLWALSPTKYGGLSYSTSDVGEVLAISGMGMLFFQLFVYPPLERIFGPVVLARIGALLTISLLSSYPFIAKLSGSTQTLVINCAALMKNVIAISITTGLFLLQNRAVSQRQRGAANGIAMSGVSLFKAFGPAVGGLLFSWAQKRSTSNASFLPGNHMVFFMLNVCEALALIMTFKPFLVAPYDNVL